LLTTGIYMDNTYVPTADEIAVALVVARRRNSLNGGGTNIPGGETATEQDRLAQHFAGCLAEIAVSRLMNLCWSGCGKGALGSKDVSGLIEVRSVTERCRGLLARNKDLDDDYCVLVFVDKPTKCCEVVGWETYRNVKAKGRALQQDTDRPCWILHADQLRPLSQLAWVMSYDKEDLRTNGPKTTTAHCSSYRTYGIALPSRLKAE